MTGLLLDQGLPRSAARLLRESGWDAVHLSECGMSEMADAVILEHARQAGRAVCTLDADFHALLALSRATGPSVIRIRRQGMRHEALASLLLRIRADIEDAVNRGAAITVTERDIRFRYLPLAPAQ